MERTLKKLTNKLSKGEKEYIINFCRMSKSFSPDYITLFKHILKEKGIKTDILQNQLINKTFLKYFSNKKITLFKKILISIMNYNLENSKSWVVLRDMLFIKTLEEKGLYDKCKNYIKRAKHNAYKLEEYLLLLNIIDCEIKLCFQDNYIIDYIHYNDLKKERKNVIAILDNLDSLLTIKTELQQYQVDVISSLFGIEHFINLYKHSPIVPEYEILSNSGSSVKISKKTTLTCCNKIRLLQYYFILLLTTFIGIT